MGIAPRLYEVHLWLKDELGDWYWEPEGGAFDSYEKAVNWYQKYKAGGYNVMIVETKKLRVWEDGKEYK